MPGGDRTGPLGMGPMTGRAAGFCAGNATPGYMNPVAGRGFGGAGRGGGFGPARGGWGRRNWFYATGLTGWQRAAQATPPAAPEGSPADAAAPYGEEIGGLKAQLEQAEAGLAALRRRLDELEERDAEKPAQ